VLCGYTDLLGPNAMISEEKTSTHVTETSFSAFLTEEEEKK
jgi:hypothetical protein